MKNKLYKLEEVKDFISQGKLLSVAGDEKMLSKLPKGNWIGGTIPYFMGDDEGLFSQELIFVTEFSDQNQNYKISSYTDQQINKVVDDTYENGFSMVIIPAFTETLKKYAVQIPSHENLFNNPIVGWIAGMDLNSSDKPKTYNGQNGQVYEDEIVSIHFELPEEKIARLEITNIFSPQSEGVEIQFLEDGFNCGDCLVNGEKINFAEYIRDNNIDIKLPIITDYSGALINVSFQRVENDLVNFYAPVFKDTIYKFSKPVLDYVSNFNEKIELIEKMPDFSCNCILNYLYGELEGKKINNVSGPITFGEVGYQLLNQTLTYLFVEDK